MRANPLLTSLVGFGGLCLSACAGNGPVAAAASSPPSPSPAPLGWTLQWSDEFEGVGLPDPASWAQEEGLVYLILNVAVGGAWGGERGIDDAVFPQRMPVDYVRIFSRS